MFTQDDLDFALTDLAAARREEAAALAAECEAGEGRLRANLAAKRRMEAERLVLQLRQAIGRQNISEAARILGAKVTNA